MWDRTTGAAVLAGFGALWWIAGAGAVDGPSRLALVAFGGLVVAALAFAIRRQRHESPGVPAGEWESSVRRRFLLVNIGQGIAIALAIAVAVAIDRPAAIPGLVCLIVGLHFLPLAALFRLDRYRWTGIGLAILGVAGVVAGLRGPPTAAQAMVGFGAAVILWVVAATIVLRP